jgi:predicted component of type VI protein secretion system
MDPTFGVATMVYDPMTSSEAIAFGYAEAIERCEPRIQDINVIILEESGDLVKMLFELTPRDQLTPLTRIYPHYRKV